MNLDSLAKIERHLNTTKRKVNRIIVNIDKALAALSNGSQPAPSRRASGNGRRGTRKITRKGRAKFKLLGRYMGTVRNLTAHQRAEAKKIREEHGYLAAIKWAQHAGDKAN